MIQIKQQWLAPAPWESIVILNQALCKEKSVAHQPKPPHYEKAKKLWDEAGPRLMSLRDALDLCRRCQEIAPFTFFNANTFGAIAKTLVEEGLKGFPPVEAQIIRTTVSHYVAGQVGKSELKQILQHFEKLWLAKNSSPRSANPSAIATKPATISQIQPA